jgi:indole-3-glycerol phosphate synthase
MTTEAARSYLDTILEAKKQYLAERQQKTPTAAVVALAEMQARPKPVLNIVTDGAQVTLIGQITLQDTYDPVAAALRYIRSGVDAVSFFTDQRVYRMGMDDLLLVTHGVRNFPVIAQNYVLDEYQVIETRAAGASGLVAYSAVLDRSNLRRVISLAHRWKMTAILQVSNAEEIAYATAVSPHVIGIGNGTDLYFDPERDLPLIRQLIPLVPFHTRMMALGCICTLEDAAAVVDLGVDAVIADETLIASPKYYEKLRALLTRQLTR